MVLAFVPGFVTLALLMLFCRASICKSPLFRFMISGVCIAVFIFTFVKFTDFTLDRVLLHTPRAAVALFFAAVVGCFLFAKTRAIEKFCLLALVVSLVFCAVIMLAAANNFEFSNADCLPGADMKEILHNFFIIFFPAFIPALDGRRSIPSALAGFSLAAAVFIGFSLFTVFNFGKVNELLTYPVLALSDTVNIGRIFTRLGSLLQAIIFVTCLIRCVVSLKAVKALYRPLGG